MLFQRQAHISQEENVVYHSCPYDEAKNCPGDGHDADAEDVVEKI